jgi:hypothetical protein
MPIIILQTFHHSRSLNYKYIKNKLYYICFVLVFLSSCRDDFSPYRFNATFPVTYCVLDTRAQEQFVMVQGSYFENDSGKSSQNIKVKLTENYGTTWEMRDTIIPNYDGLNAYYLPGFQPKRNASYRLTVNLDTITQFTEISIPPVTKPTITCKIDTNKGYTVNYFVFTFRAAFSKSAPSVNAIGVYIDCEKDINGIKTRSVMQIPINSACFDTLHRIADFDFWMNPVANYLKPPVYPDFPYTGKNWTQSFYRSDKTSYYIDLPPSNFFYTFDVLGKGCNAADITIKGGFVVFYAVDAFLYENCIQQKNEVYSVRLDNPYIPTNFSNSAGKPFGFFSYVTVDTTKFTIPWMIVTKFNYKNGQ